MVDSSYRGDKWDAFYSQLPLSLVNHLNGNAIYNVSSIVLNKIVGQLEREANTTGNAIPYDYRIGQMVEEAKHGEQTVFPDFNLPRPNQTALIAFLKDQPLDALIKETRLIGNYAATNMIPEFFNEDEFIVHGAKMYSSWDGVKMGEITLLVSDWAGDDHRTLSSLVKLPHPFDQVVLMVPGGADVEAPPSLKTPLKVVNREPGQDSSFDVCSARISTPWFMITDKLHRFKPSFRLMATEEGKVVTSYAGPKESDCLEDFVCSSEFGMAEELQKDTARVFRNNDFVFHSSHLTEYCNLWTQQFTVEDSPGATSFVAFLEAKGIADGLYHFVDRVKYGSRDAFTLLVDDTMIHGRILQQTNVTNSTCTIQVIEPDCLANGCEWRNEFGNCRDLTNSTCTIQATQADCLANACEWRDKFGNCRDVSSLSPTTPSALPSMSNGPSTSPTASGSFLATVAPSLQPTVGESRAPSTSPSLVSSTVPTLQPSSTESPSPSKSPSLVPSMVLSLQPSIADSSAPSKFPSLAPSTVPTLQPSSTESPSPSKFSSLVPSAVLSPPPSAESSAPSNSPSLAAPAVPLPLPSATASSAPSKALPLVPSTIPTLQSSTSESPSPSKDPSLVPQTAPSLSPSATESSDPTNSAVIVDLPRFAVVLDGPVENTEALTETLAEYLESFIQDAGFDSLQSIDLVLVNRTSQFLQEGAHYEFTGIASFGTQDAPVDTVKATDLEALADQVKAATVEALDDSLGLQLALESNEQIGDVTYSHPLYIDPYSSEPTSAPTFLPSLGPSQDTAHSCCTIQTTKVACLAKDCEWRNLLETCHDLIDSEETDEGILPNTIGQVAPLSDGVPPRSPAVLAFIVIGIFVGSIAILALSVWAAKRFVGNRNVDPVQEEDEEDMLADIRGQDALSRSTPENVPPMSAFLSDPPDGYHYEEHFESVYLTQDGSVVELE